MKYMVVIEKGKASYGVHVPDLPGCIAVGQSRKEVLKLIRKAIEFHIEARKLPVKLLQLRHRLANTSMFMLRKAQDAIHY